MSFLFKTAIIYRIQISSSKKLNFIKTTAILMQVQQKKRKNLTQVIIDKVTLIERIKQFKTTIFSS